MAAQLHLGYQQSANDAGHELTAWLVAVLCMCIPGLGTEVSDLMIDYIPTSAQHGHQNMPTMQRVDLALTTRPVPKHRKTVQITVRHRCRTHMDALGKLQLALGAFNHSVQIVKAPQHKAQGPRNMDGCTVAVWLLLGASQVLQKLTLMGIDQHLQTHQLSAC